MSYKTKIDKCVINQLTGSLLNQKLLLTFANYKNVLINQDTRKSTPVILTII